MVGDHPLQRLPVTATPLAPSSAWRDGDPPAWRKFATFCEDRLFALEGGGRLGPVTVAYETWGSLDASASNAILVCHALTGDAHAAGGIGPGQATSGWWDEMIGPGKPLDTDRYFVVCANVLGSCQGTTGPSSPHPLDGKPYGSRFPVVSTRDTVRMQSMLANYLRIDCWLSVIGGSMGGMQVIEWGVMFPDRVQSLVVIASAASASPLQIAWSQAGRLAIALDPAWKNGDYYDADDGEGPNEGLMLARRIAHIHYRSDDSLDTRFGRDVVHSLDSFGMWDKFEVENYLDYQGRKLARRFDANSYLVLNKAMDLHDIGRGRGGLDAALRRVSSPVLVVSIDSDALYTPRQQIELRDGLLDQGKTVEFETLHSMHGHDGFLMEFRQLGPMIERFVTDVDKCRP